MQTSDVDQLFVERTDVATSDGASYNYDLCAVMLDGERTLLLHITGNHGARIARLIEDEVEQYLGIEDRHVKGEHESVAEKTERSDNSLRPVPNREPISLQQDNPIRFGTLTIVAMVLFVVLCIASAWVSQKPDLVDDFIFTIWGGQDAIESGG